jgi:hypothetical protein
VGRIAKHHRQHAGRQNEQKEPLEVGYIRMKDLPELLARVINAMVDTLRIQFARQKKTKPEELPLWKGKVICRLTREQIYDC